MIPFRRYINNITLEHTCRCSSCAGKGLYPSCYISNCVPNGWSPPVDTGSIRRADRDNTNYYTVTSNNKLIYNKGINIMVSDGVPFKVANGNADAIVTPFQAVSKSRSLIATKVHVGHAEAKHQMTSMISHHLLT